MEEGEGVGGAEAVDAALVGAPDDEVGALAGADLVGEYAADDARVLLVRHVEAAALDADAVRGQGVEQGGGGQLVDLVGDEHGQRRAVVADVEAALADLPVRHERERPGGTGRRAAGDVREPVHLVDGTEEDLDGRVGAARGAAAEDGERRGAVGQQPHGPGRRRPGRRPEPCPGRYPGRRLRARRPRPPAGPAGVTWGMLHGSFLPATEGPTRGNTEGRPSGGLRGVFVGTRDQVAAGRTGHHQVRTSSAYMAETIAHRGASNRSLSAPSHLSVTGRDRAGEPVILDP